jgi:hypothetical protein
MRIVRTPPVETAIRTLGVEDRQKVRASLDQLRSWEDDPAVRRRSRKLPSTANVYVLKTNNDLRIFFRVESDRIDVLDIATRATILSFGQASEPGQ